MAKKRKLSARQKAARKHKSYLRAEYYKNYDALEYLRNFMYVKDVLIPQEITEASVRYIRKIYKEARANLKQYNETGYVDIVYGKHMTKAPTLTEMARQARAKDPEKTWRKKRPKKSPPTPDGQPIGEPFNPDQEYIDDFKTRLRTITPKVDKSKNREAKVTAAKDAWLDAIDNAIKKYGAQQVAQTLAQDNYIQRLENIPEQYAYELIDDAYDYAEEMDELVNSSVTEALTAL